jgi:hypothetical protein
MPQKLLVKDAATHRRRARRFVQLAKARHRQANRLAALALVAERQGRPVQARSLLRRAMQLKAGAGRAGLRGRLHAARAAEIHRARRPKKVR